MSTSSADGQGANSLDEDSDGPLDPSAFDDLFDDIAPGGPVARPIEDQADDNPLADFLAAPLSEDGASSHQSPIVEAHVEIEAEAQIEVPVEPFGDQPQTAGDQTSVPWFGENQQASLEPVLPHDLESDLEPVLPHDLEPPVEQELEPGNDESWHDTTPDDDGVAWYSHFTGELDGVMPGRPLPTVEDPPFAEAFDPTDTVPDVEPEPSVSAEADPYLSNGVAGRTNDIYDGPVDPQPIQFLDDQHRANPQTDLDHPDVLKDHPDVLEGPDNGTGPPVEVDQTVGLPAPEPDPTLGPTFEPVDSQPVPPAQPVHPPAQPVHSPDVVVAPAPHLPVQTVDRPKRRRWPAFLVAIVLGGGLGVGAAVVVSNLVQSSSDPSQPGAGAADGTDTEVADDEAESGVGDLVAPTTDHLELASLEFVPGTEELTEASLEALGEVAAAIERDPGAPLAGTVRSYSEANAADNLALSLRQAAALEQRLIELGADPDVISVVGVGQPLLSPAQPIPNFVVASAGFPASVLRDEVQAINPFAIGIDGRTGLLRPESVSALDRLAAAMIADPDGRQITLAAYAFDQADDPSNQRLAGEAAAVAAQYLEQRHEIDPARVRVVNLGAAPFSVPEGQSNQIVLRWGTVAGSQVMVQNVPVETIDFEIGQSAVTAESQAIVDQLASVLASSEATIVLDIHSFDGADSAENLTLSQQRAQTLGGDLIANGVRAEQIQLFAADDRPQFRSEGRTARVVVSLVELSNAP